MSARLLAIETSSAVGSIALFSGDERLVIAKVPHQKDAGRSLGAVVQRALAEAGWGPADLDRLALSIGPGSFTGLRVGLAFVKGLTIALPRPVVAISSLRVLAEGARRAAPGTERVLVSVDARGGLSYGALFTWAEGRWREDPRFPEAAVPAGTLPTLDAPTLLVGSGIRLAASPPPEGRPAPAEAEEPSAEALAELARAGEGFVVEGEALLALEPAYRQLPPPDARALGKG